MFLLFYFFFYKIVEQEGGKRFLGRKIWHQWEGAGCGKGVGG
jgi:hypothetical protein